MKRIFLFNFLLIILMYFIFEFSFRIISHQIFGFVKELNKFNELKNIENFNYYMNEKIPYLDDDIGFLKKNNLNKKNKKTITVNGDSVSFGIGTKKNFVNYLKEYTSDNFNIFNLSTPNHGIYQIAHSFNNNNKKLKAELNLITHIAHDLIRPGKTYMSTMLRPKYNINKKGFEIIKNYNYEQFIRSYINSKKYFYNSLWILNFLFENRKYYLPKLYKNFYQNIYIESFEKLASTIEDQIVIIILLPTNYEFNNRDFLIDLFYDSFMNFSNKKNIQLIDIEKCVFQNLEEKEINYYNYASKLHPDQIMHEAYAKCIKNILWIDNLN